MPTTAAGHRVIGIRHFARSLRTEGLIAPRQYYPSQAANHIRRRGAARVQRWVNRILEDVSKAMKTGKLSRRLRDAEIVVRVGNDLVPVSIDVPEAVAALERKRKTP